jgi:hypothetical protein
VTLPIFGLYAIALWGEFLTRRRSEAPSSAPKAHLDLSRRRAPLPSGVRFRRFYRSGLFSVWLATSFLPVMVWALWLVKAPSLGSYRWPAILGACFLLHLMVFVCLRRHTRPELKSSACRGWRRAFLLASPFLSLLSTPGVFLAFSAFLLRSARNTLSGEAHDSRGSAARIPSWKRLQGEARRQWQGKPWSQQWRRPFGLEVPDLDRKEEEQVLRLYRLKTLSLVLESGALLAAVMALAIHFPDLQPRLNAIVRYAMLIAAGAAALGLLVQAVGLSARALRIQDLADGLSRHPYGRYLLLTQAAFLAGFEGEFMLAQRQVKELGILLTAVGILCVTLLSLIVILAPFLKQGPRKLWIWDALFFALSLLGACVAALGERRASLFLTILRISAVLSPLRSLGLFHLLGGWLLRPFSWSQVLDRTMPARLRGTIVLLTLTAALPLGGLAIPFWIYARQRLLPRYERPPRVGYHQGDGP